MIPAIMLAVVGFLIVAAMLSRQTTKAKKRAIADLEAEKESVGKFDIFELVESEIDALGLLEIAGAQDVPHGVLLKVWTDSEDVVTSCAGREHLRYVVSEGVDPEQATDGDVSLVCGQPIVDQSQPPAPTDS